MRTHLQQEIQSQKLSASNKSMRTQKEIWERRVFSWVLGNKPEPLRTLSGSNATWTVLTKTAKLILRMSLPGWALWNARNSNNKNWSWVAKPGWLLTRLNSDTPWCPVAIIRTWIPKRSFAEVVGWICMQQGPWEGCSLKPAPHHPISTQRDGFEIAYLQREERIHFHCFRSVLISYNRKLKFGAHDNTEEKSCIKSLGWQPPQPRPGPRVC